MKTHSLVAPFVAVALLCLGFMAWGTSLVLTPGVITYTATPDGQIIASWRREVVRGGAWIDWHTECRSVASGVERSADGTRFYQEDAEVIRYPVAPEMVRCFQDGVPVEVHHQWQWLFLGFVPTRPVTRDYVVELPPPVILPENVKEGE